MHKTKPACYYIQSGVVPYTKDHNDIKVMLVTSRSGKRWIVPKGIVESGMTPLESARKEALEEAGITGSIETESIGSYRYEKWGGTCTVTMFKMEIETILDVWDEAGQRERELLTIDEAAGRVEEPALKEMIQALREA